MPSISYSEKSCSVRCKDTDKLTDLAFALEFMSNNFLGRGVNRWEVKFVKMPLSNFNPDGGCSVIATTSQPSGKMLISQVARLGEAVRQGVIPRILRPTDSFHLDDKKIVFANDGQNRRLFSTKTEGLTESFIESQDVDPNIQLSILSYGFADMMTGLIALGVKEFKYQITQAVSQLYIKHNLSDKQLLAYFQQEDGNDYDIEETVASLK